MQKSLGETIAELIKKSIWNQEYQLGERLLEKDLANKYDVSRSTIREAFTILENEGLLVNKARKGTFISQFTEQDLIEVIELRILIEKAALVKALPLLKETDFKALAVILEAMKKEVESANWYALFNLDIEFHQTIVNLCGNSRMIKIFEMNQIQMRTYISYLEEYYASPEDFYKEHLKLFNLLKSNNIDKVTKGLKDHILYAKEKLIRKRR